MTDDATPRDPLTDDELAFLRHVRFGELPPRVSPEARTAATETEPPRRMPEPEPERPPYG